MNPPRNGMPEFYNLLERMADTHDKKSHDYASNRNPAGNYHFAGEIALLFSHSSQDAGFAGRIAEKLYRLANLEGTGKTPNNESIEDTEIDIVTITALWMADRKRRREKVYLPTEVMTFREAAIKSCFHHDKYEIGCENCRKAVGHT